MNFGNRRFRHSRNNASLKQPCLPELLESVNMLSLSTMNREQCCERDLNNNSSGPWMDFPGFSGHVGVFFRLFRIPRDLRRPDDYGGALDCRKSQCSQIFWSSQAREFCRSSFLMHSFLTLLKNDSATALSRQFPRRNHRGDIRGAGSLNVRLNIDCFNRGRGGNRRNAHAHA